MSELDSAKKMVALAQRVMREQNEKIKKLRLTSGVMEHRIFQLENMILANNSIQEEALDGYSNDDIRDDGINQITNYDTNEQNSLDSSIIFDILPYSHFNLDCIPNVSSNDVPLINTNEQLFQIDQSGKSTNREQIACKKNDDSDENILNLFSVEERGDDLLTELVEKRPKNVSDNKSNPEHFICNLNSNLEQTKDVYSQGGKTNKNIVSQYMEIYHNYLDQTIDKRLDQTKIDHEMEICALSLDSSQLGVGNMEPVCLMNILNKTDNCNNKIKHKNTAQSNKSKRVRPSVKKPRGAVRKRNNTKTSQLTKTVTSAHTKNSEEVYDILNIKSIYTKEMEESSVEVVPNTQTPEKLDDHTDQLIRIVEQNQLQLFTTDDKDTFIISVNGDMDPQHLRKLLSDGILTIHVDEEDKGTTAKKMERGSNSKNVSNIVNFNSYNSTNVLNQNNYLQTSKTNVVLPSTTYSNNDVIMLVDNGSNVVHNIIPSNVRNSTSISLSDIDVDNLLKLNNVNDVSSILNCNQSRLIFVTDDGGIRKEKRSREFVCKECNKRFIKKENYLSHKGTHNVRSKKHRCSQCGQKYSWRSSLVKHTADKHSPVKENCSHCTKSFASKRQVQVHVKRVHTKECKFRCTHAGCDKTFYNNYGLTLHIRSHTGERIYPCGICGMKFTQASHRGRHEKSHTKFI